MGLFTPNGYNVSTEAFDIENMTFDECAYENPFEAASYIVAESVNNYNSIMKAIALDEFGVYESTGVEMVYEAANFKAFFAKIKEFFKKLWEKIKGMFQKFFAKINSLVMKDKEFVKKYKKQLMAVKTKDFEYKGYTFTNLDKALPGGVEDGTMVSTSIQTLGKGGNVQALLTYAEDRSGDSLESLLDSFRGSTLNGGKVESSDYSTELFKYFRKGEESKEYIKDVKVSELLGMIEKTDTSKKAAEKDLKNLKKHIDEILKALDKAENEVVKETPSTDIQSAMIKAYSASTTVLKERMNIVTLWSGAKLKALKDQNAQAKSVCVKLLTYKPKNESAGFVHTEGGSYLDSVVFK